ncbi:hypothetical protein MAPG_02569 [Magnaporthiopsis poae ATCC 64411]|uniref:Protein yippee-like n=1 Tax=Magnaporthiopsis poae (strain ATCC 64411 / 73-15) TaxID=644358 RepID=A0A0C4CSB9_MAGP6|nr:hypothetical protein, variant [Magnaporthiopsis poae ATCC 64411]KLU83510.1 hypothetical protein MAPG_02569 [Magnaporthiopsis poae ATCC 64411]
MKAVPHSDEATKQTTTATTTTAQDTPPNDAAVDGNQTTAIQADTRLNINMGLAYNTYLNSNKIYGCKSCKAHLANHEDIISRNFRGQHGKAYLFAFVVNVETCEPSERNMTTGRHIVRDITCRQCKETVGWKYDKAYEPSEKYKEGKFILEAELLCNVS